MEIEWDNVIKYDEKSKIETITYNQKTTGDVLHVISHYTKAKFISHCPFLNVSPGLYLVS